MSIALALYLCACVAIGAYCAGVRLERNRWHRNIKADAEAYPSSLFMGREVYRG